MWLESGRSQALGTWDSDAPARQSCGFSRGFCDAFTWKLNFLRHSGILHFPRAFTFACGMVPVTQLHFCAFALSRTGCFWKEADLTRGQVSSLTKAQRQTWAVLDVRQRLFCSQMRRVRGATIATTSAGDSSLHAIELGWPSQWQCGNAHFCHLDCIRGGHEQEMRGIRDAGKGGLSCCLLLFYLDEQVRSRSYGSVGDGLFRG